MIWQVTGVTEAHDLHVWALKPGVTLLAVHLNLAPGADGACVLQQSTGYCRSLGIDHSTIQLIKDGEECCGQNVGMLSSNNSRNRYLSSSRLAWWLLQSLSLACR